MTATRAERGLALLVGGGLAAIFMIWGAIHVAGWTLGTATRSEHRVIHVAAGHGLHITNDGRGDVVLEAGSGPDVTVDAQARGSFRAPRLRLDVNGSSLHVRGGCRAVLLGRCSASVTVHVPPGTGVDVSSHGDVSAFGLTGLVAVTTASGDVTAGDLSAPAVLHTGSGDIQVHDLTGTASLEASSGDVEGSDLSGDTVRARTGSGDVDLVFSAAPRRADAETGSGDVNVIVPRSAIYSVDAETSSGDRVIGVPNAPHAAHALRVRAGSGDVTVFASS